MKLLVIGKNGQLASELSMLDGVVCAGRGLADLAHPETCAAAIRNSGADAVINAAAYTAVDQAETDEATATLINGTAPGIMAATAASLGIPFINISTDYVFDGSGSHAWTPNHPTGPLQAYGRSKLAGECAVAAAGGAYANIRTSWVFSAHGNNFVKTMLRLGAERDSLAIVADQIGAPTSARDIARTCQIIAHALAANPDAAGTYHFASDENTSWADFARTIFAASGLGCAVQDIPTSAYKTPARRPLNSRLDCTSLSNTFGIPRPDWADALHTVLKEL